VIIDIDDLIEFHQRRLALFRRVTSVGSWERRRALLMIRRLRGLRSRIQ
jgi:hypothetical protein